MTSPYSWLHHAIEHAAHYLPAQAPLDVFVHHNTLHAFEHFPFHDALAEAQSKLGANGFLPEEAYGEAYARGRIVEADLDAAIASSPAFRDTVMPRRLPRASELAKLVLMHGIRPESPAGLKWRLQEHRAAERFDASVSAVARDRILRGTAARRVDGAPDQELERRSIGALWEVCREVTRLFPVAVPGRSDPLRSGFPRDLVLRVTDLDPNDLVNPVLINLAGAFLDRGQSRWSMPDRDAGFFVAFCQVLGAGHAVRPAWLASLGRRVRRWTAEGSSPEDVVSEALAEMGIGEHERAAFVEYTLLLLAGWAGMFHRLEAAPGPVGRSRALVRLVDFLAVRLTLDTLALADVARRVGHRGPLQSLRAHLERQRPLWPEPAPGDHDRAWPLFLLSQHAGMGASEIAALGESGARALLELIVGFDRSARLGVWQEAFEHHYREQLLRAFVSVRTKAAATLGAVRESAAPPRFQVVFCIDERNESMRRHFEELSDAHETFGAAGFYNLAIAYQGIDDPATFPLCPVVVSPQHEIHEEPVSEHAELAEARRRWKRRMGSAAARFDDASRSVLWGPLVVVLAGFLSALPLLATVFAPRWTGTLRKRLTGWLLPAPRTRLHFPSDDRTSTTSDELATGFSVAEKAARVGDLLENMGLVRGFARVVTLLGHDSSSVNNPHFAAYSCGACGGRSGGPNARLFARMANRPEVRALLRERGIAIPPETVFVGGVHNTCTEAIELFDTDALSAAVVPEIEALQSALEAAAQRNAHERCRRFASAPDGASPEACLRHAEQRAFDLSQARPELGHATNASCFVGRRARCRGLFLDRRMFLVSYDPEIDRDGRLLERLLGAVVPVGAGINLEYYFSTVDNERFGAGTKLPHNVVALCGVMNGASSDLRTGLPRQMIEIHEPIRLQLIIEARTETLRAILERQPSIQRLVLGEWVRVCSLDPDTGAVAVLDPRGGFVTRKLPDGPLPRVARSRDWYSGKGGFLPPALVSGVQEIRDVA